MQSLQACLLKYSAVSVFRIYALHGEDDGKGGGLELCIKYSHGNYMLVMENHGKIMELCFLISVGTLFYYHVLPPLNFKGEGGTYCFCSGSHYPWDVQDIS